MDLRCVNIEITLAVERARKEIIRQEPYTGCPRCRSRRRFGALILVCGRSRVATGNRRRRIGGRDPNERSGRSFAVQEPGHPQSVDNQWPGHPPAHRETGHLPAEQGDDDRGLAGSVFRRAISIRSAPTVPVSAHNPPAASAFRRFSGVSSERHNVVAAQQSICPPRASRAAAGLNSGVDRARPTPVV